jgi:alpha-methylacyl-CoA racemase
MSGEPRGALAGTRVLDLTRHIPGPYATMMLADLGADVVKVEAPPAGDPARRMSPIAGGDGAPYAALNRNKRSIVLDIRQEQGGRILRLLAEKADVFVEGFRPGVVDRLGVGAEALRSQNPRLVYCSLTGYGPDGPMAPLAGHDINYISMAGLLGTNRDEGGRPVLPTTQLADMAGALFATIAILAALQARERTGEGQLLQISLFEAALSLMTVPAARLLAGGSLQNELSGTHACYNVFRCKDGRYLSVGALESKFWEALCAATGLAGRPQWQNGETVEALGRVFATRNRDDWIRELSGVDACVTPVLGLEEALEHPQGALAVREEQSGRPSIRALANPLHLSATPTRRRYAAPTLGEHTGEILEEAGYSPAEIAALRGSGVVS